MQGGMSSHEFALPLARAPALHTTVPLSPSILIAFIHPRFALPDGKVDGGDGKVDGNGGIVGETRKDEVTEEKKERSVLQAKLTRLAIQIGYAGTSLSRLMNPLSTPMLFRFLRGGLHGVDSRDSLLHLALRDRRKVVRSRGFPTFHQIPHHRCYRTRGGRAGRTAVGSDAVTRVFREEGW